MSDLGREFTLIAATRNLIKVVERGRHETQVPSRKFLKFLPQSGTLKIPAGFLGIISVTVEQVIQPARLPSVAELADIARSVELITVGLS